MTYVISDLHGHLCEFEQMLEKIHFSSDDYLYILGDVIDRGPDSTALLRKVMKMENVKLLPGNHELMMIQSILGYKADMSNLHISLDGDRTEIWLHSASRTWLNPRNGGNITYKQLQELKLAELMEIVQYLVDVLHDAEVHITVNGRKYTLVHTLPREVFAAINRINPYYFDYPDNELKEMVWNRDLMLETIEDDPKIEEFKAPLSQLKAELGTVIIGHTPVQNFNRTEIVKLPSLYAEHQFLIDCGAAYGGKLACICLETGEVYYQDGIEKKHIK